MTKFQHNLSIVICYFIALLIILEGPEYIRYALSGAFMGIVGGLAWRVN